MRFFLIVYVVFFSLEVAASSSGVRIKDLARIDMVRDYAVVGYGLVIGLSGTGDSQRNEATLQSLSNALEGFGLQIDSEDLNSRNVASVMITARLTAFGEVGDKFDVNVASIGDARSLSGGTLLLTPLYGADKKLYALAQGPVIVGGYEVESFSNSRKKNHTTVGQVSSGGNIERSLYSGDVAGGEINVILNEPDFTTAKRVRDRLQSTFPAYAVKVVHPGKIQLKMGGAANFMSDVALLESVEVTPDLQARVVVNERTGIIVAGGDVTIGKVSIAYGSLKIDIDTEFQVSQPFNNFRPTDSIRTQVVPDTDISVNEQRIEPVSLPAGTSVNDLVQSLQAINLSVRDVISILQSLQAAGALHAELITQ